VLFIPEKLHLFLVGKREKPLALCKHLVHEFLAYAMVDNIEKTGIQTRLQQTSKLRSEDGGTKTER